MDPSGLERVSPLEEFGEGLLVDPNDCCIIQRGPNECQGVSESDSYLIAVADMQNGVVVFDRQGNVAKHLTETKEATSLCFDPISNNMIVSASMSNGTGKIVWKLLFVNVANDWKVQSEIEYPSEPQVKPEYPRWICIDSKNRTIFTTVADNTTATLFACKFSFDGDSSKVVNYEWTLLQHAEGNMERPYLMPQSSEVKDDGLLAVRYTDKDGWTIELHTIGIEPNTGKLKITSSKTVYSPSNEFIREPWNVIVDNKGENAYVHCGKYGYVWRVCVDKTVLSIAEMVAIIPSGQVIGMALGGENDLWLSCSSDRLLKLYTARSAKKTNT